MLQARHGLFRGRFAGLTAFEPMGDGQEAAQVAARSSRHAEDAEGAGSRSSVPGPVFPRQIDDFRPVLKMKRIKMIPLATPYESKSFEDIDNLIWDSMASIERTVALLVPKPVVAEFVVEIDRRAVRVH